MMIEFVITCAHSLGIDFEFQDGLWLNNYRFSARQFVRHNFHSNALILTLNVKDEKLFRSSEEDKSKTE